MTAQTIPFPRERKRGAKVRNGPLADMLKFPDSLRELWLTSMTMPKCGYAREDWEAFAPGVEAMDTPAGYRQRIRERIDSIRAELDALEARGF